MINKISKVPSVKDINSFIEDFLMSEFEKLQEIQNNCNSNIQKFSKLMTKLDPATMDIIRGVIDNLTLENYTINNVKNNIAMKLYKREIGLKQDIKDVQNRKAKLETDYEHLKETLNTLENERVTLQEQLVKKPVKDKFNITFLKKFQKHEAQLKDELSAELDKWLEFKSKLEAVDINLDKDIESDLERSKIIISELNQELKETNTNLKSKLTDNHTFLKKKKNIVKEKLSEEKKKYESIKKKLKSGLDDPEEITELKSEMAFIINKIDSLVKEYNNLLKLLELKKEDLYVILQILPGFGGSEFDNIIDYNEDELKQSIKREKELQVQLEIALRSVDELKADIEVMDKTFQTKIKKEHKRLQGELKADHEREFNENVKNFESKEISKIDKKYKKLLKKQEEKYQKNFELAGKRIFELEQIIVNIQKLDGRAEHMMPGQVIKNKNMHSKKNGIILRKPKVSRMEQPKKNGEKSTAKGQCGACGSYISVDSDSCPNCGVNFSRPDQELGTCGQCGNLIPISLGQCPICGVKFK